MINWIKYYWYRINWVYKGCCLIKRSSYSIISSLGSLYRMFFISETNNNSSIQVLCFKKSDTLWEHNETIWTSKCDTDLNMIWFEYRSNKIVGLFVKELGCDSILIWEALTTYSSRLAFVSCLDLPSLQKWNTYFT